MPPSKRRTALSLLSLLTGAAALAVRFPAPVWNGYTKPGPLPSKAAAERLTLEDGETLDALSGNWMIFQLKHGHRYSTDDVLCAWYGTSWCPSAAHVLELGSGVGSVGLVAAWRLRGASFVTVEAQAVSLALAQKSVQYNDVAGRFDQRLGDFRFLRGETTETGDDGPLGADEVHFELVLGSPPYWPPSDGTVSKNPQKVNS